MDHKTLPQEAVVPVNAVMESEEASMWQGSKETTTDLERQDIV